MTTQPKHTPTPWKAIEHENKNAFEGNIVITPNDMNDAVCTVWTCDTEEETQANAAFIVRACNSHAALVEALEDLFNCCMAEIDEDGECINEGFSSNSALGKAKAALTLAKGE